MKTFTRLREEVVFESGATDYRQYETIAGLIIEEVLDEYTAQVKYDELFVVDQALTVGTLASGLINLPTDYQHIDWDSFRIRFEGSDTDQRILKKLTGRVTGPNEGKSRYYTRTATQIRVWPYAELTVNDTFYLNYWRKSNAKTNNLIVPDQLVGAVKAQAIMRLGLTVGNKNAVTYAAIARDSHANSLGATDLPPV